MAMISNWISGVLSPSTRHMANDENHKPPDRTVPKSSASKFPDDAKFVEYRGRPLKEIPIAKLKRALADDFRIFASENALRAELMHLLARAIRGTGEDGDRTETTKSELSSKKRDRDELGTSESPQASVSVTELDTSHVEVDASERPSKRTFVAEASTDTSPSAVSEEKNATGSPTSSTAPVTASAIPSASTASSTARVTASSATYPPSASTASSTAPVTASSATYPPSASTATSTAPVTASSATYPPLASEVTSKAPEPSKLSPPTLAPSSFHPPSGKETLKTPVEGVFGAVRSDTASAQRPTLRPFAFTPLVDDADDLAARRASNSSTTKRILETLQTMSVPFDGHPTPSTDGFDSAWHELLSQAKPKKKTTSMEQAHGTSHQPTEKASSEFVALAEPAPSLSESAYSFAPPTPVQEATTRRGLDGASYDTAPPTFAFSPPGSSSSKPLNPLFLRGEMTTEERSDEVQHRKETVSSGVSTPETEIEEAVGWGDLFKKHDEGKWKCECCLAKNENKLTKCAACEASKPGSAPEARRGGAVAATSTSSSRSIGASGFTFGAPSNTAATAPAMQAQPTFAFGASTSQPSALAGNTKTTVPFHFGAPSTQIAAVSTLSSTSPEDYSGPSFDGNEADSRGTGEFSFTAPSAVSGPFSPRRGDSSWAQKYAFSPPSTKTAQPAFLAPPQAAPDSTTASESAAGGRLLAGASASSTTAPAGCGASGESGTSDSSSSGWGDLFKKHDEGKWKCECCLAKNDDELTKCAACEAAKPGSAPQAPSGEAAAAKTSSSSSSIGVGGFTFGAPSNSTATAPAIRPQTTFSFGVSTSQPLALAGNAKTTTTGQSSTSQPVAPFHFGVPSTQIATVSAAPSSTSVQESADPSSDGNEADSRGTGEFSFTAPLTVSLSPRRVGDSSSTNWTQKYAFSPPSMKTSRPAFLAPPQASSESDSTPASESAGGGGGRLLAGASSSSTTAPAGSGCASVSGTSDSTSSGWGDLFKKHEQGKWKCECCLAKNEDKLSNCAACEASKPGCGPEAPKGGAAVASSSSSSGIGAGGFTFGAPSNSTATPPAMQPQPTFTFGAPSSSTSQPSALEGNTKTTTSGQSSTSQPVAPFHFGAPSTQTAAVSAAASSTSPQKSTGPSSDGNEADSRGAGEFSFTAPSSVSLSPRRGGDSFSSNWAQKYAFSPPSMKTSQPAFLAPPQASSESDSTPASEAGGGRLLSASSSCSTMAPAGSGCNASRESATSDSTSSGWGDLFKKHDEGKWKCECCLAKNDDELTKCAACEASKPGSAPEAPKGGAAAASSSSSSSIEIGGFTFGAPSNSTATAPAMNPQPTFTFGALPSSTFQSSALGGNTKIPGQSSTTQPIAAFHFGAPSSQTGASSAPSSSSTKESTGPSSSDCGAGGFSFTVPSSPRGK